MSSSLESQILSVESSLTKLLSEGSSASSKSKLCEEIASIFAELSKATSKGSRAAFGAALGATVKASCEYFLASGDAGAAGLLCLLLNAHGTLLVASPAMNSALSAILVRDLEALDAPAGLLASHCLESPIGLAAICRLINVKNLDAKGGRALLRRLRGADFRAAGEAWPAAEALIFRALSAAGVSRTEEPEAAEEALKALYSVISTAPRALVFADLLTSVVEQATALGVKLQALKCLARLVGSSAFEFGKFFAQLYSLVSADVRIFEGKEAQGFLKLLEAALSSDRLSQALAGNFAKVLLRAALVAPPRAALSLAFLLFNLFKKHSGLSRLIRPLPPSADPFSPSTPIDQVNAKGLFFWEVFVLRKHYSPRVRAVFQALGPAAEKLDFLDLDDAKRVAIHKLRAQCRQKLNLE